MMNKKMDLSSVVKKVDSNVDEARAHFKLQKEEEEKK
jgi:hypothetical protein